MRNFAVELSLILTRRERWMAAGLVVLLLLGAIAEAVGIGAIAPIVSIISDPGLAHKNDVLAALYRGLGAESVPQFVVFLCVALLVFFLAKNAYLMLCSAVQARYVFAKERQLCTELLRRYVNAPYEVHQRRSRAEMLRLATAETNRLATGVLAPAFALLAECLVVVLIAALLLSYRPAIALAAIGFLVLAGWGIHHLLSRLTSPYRTARLHESAALFRSASDALAGLREIRVFGAEEYFFQRFFAHAERYARATGGFAAFSAAPRLAVETVAAAAALGVISVTALAGAGDPAAVTTLALFAVATLRVLPSVSRILVALNSIAFFAPSLHAVAAELRDFASHSISSTAHSRIPVQTELALRNVSFRYSGSKDWALSGITLRIPRSGAIAVVGGSGSGKSTLAAIFLGLLSPTEGEVLIDGRALAKGALPRAGFVPQEAFVLGESVRNNVAFGLPRKEIDDAWVWRALEGAMLAVRIRAFPEGLDTVLGDVGVALSGGERQRLIIARALYAQPDVVVLDEATSALDAQTEAEVTETIAKLAGTVTLIVIAHRARAIQCCDRIAVIEAGRIVAEGPRAQIELEAAYQRTVSEAGIRRG